MSRELRINIALRLINKDLFLKSAMEKGIAHVELTKFPLPSKSQGKNNANGGGLDDRAERFSIIKAWLLEIAFGYKTGFVALNVAGGSALNLVNLFGAD